MPEIDTTQKLPIQDQNRKKLKKSQKISKFINLAKYQLYDQTGISAT